MTALTTDILETIRQRRSAGENLALLAREAGLSWQRLWGMLYPVWPTVRPNAKAGAMTERYRPTSLSTIWGQDGVVKALRKFAAAPFPTAFVFEGETGTGKTSAAIALAGAIGCDLAQKEFGGLHVVASGEQSADAVREAYRRMFTCPWHGSGWKVVVVNEADRMARPAETIWLDALEAIPPKTVIVFTTNESGRLSQRFLDRCTRLVFESDSAKLRASAARFAAAVWKSETGKRPDRARVEQVVSAAEVGGRLSFRRLVQGLTGALGSGDAHE